MAVFQYTAKDTAGKAATGTYENIADAGALRRELGKLGYSLVKARRIKDASQPAGKVKVRQRDVVSFAFKFAGMYSAGLSVIRCLETLESNVESPAFRHVIADIRRRVETGSSLKAAFEKHADLFSDFFLGMIEAGETAGRLAESLDMSAAYLEKRAEVEHKVKSAFVYPMVVGLVCCTVVLCLLVFIVPTFGTLYARMHVQLPGPTRALLMLSGWVRGYWWTFPFVIAGLVFAVRRALADEELRARWDACQFKMPVFAKLNRLVVVARFVRAFAMLTSVGVPIIEAIEVAGRVARNRQMSRIAQDLAQSTRAGNTMARSLKAHNIFPPVIVQLAAAGEEAGVLPEMLTKGTEILEKDIDRMVSSLLVKLEPALTLVMGAIVGLILMGVYLPMFDYMSHLS